MRSYFLAFSSYLRNKPLAFSFIFRSLSIPFSITLVLVYSSWLGLERRGIVTALLTVTMISSLIFERAITITLRKRNLKVTNVQDFVHLLSLCLFGTMIIQVFLSLLLIATKNYFNTPLFFLALILSSLQSVEYFINSLLFTEGKYKKAISLQIIGSILQLGLFLGFSFSPFSIAVSLFLALMASSVIVIVISLNTIQNGMIKSELSVPMIKSQRFPSEGLIWSFNNVIHANLEKILILLVLGFDSLAKFTMCTAYLLVIKIIGELSNKFLTKGTGRESFNFILVRTFVIPLTIGVSFLVPNLWFIRNVLGENWLIPTSIVLLGTFNESLRFLINGLAITMFEVNDKVLNSFPYTLLLIASLAGILAYAHISSTEEFYEVIFIYLLCNILILIFYGLKYREIRSENG